MKQTLRIFHNGAALPLHEIPLLETDSFLQGIIDAIDSGWQSLREPVRAAIYVRVFVVHDHSFAAAANHDSGNR